MNWPDATEKYWFCGRATRGLNFCVRLESDMPENWFKREPCSSHQETWAGWVQADNRRQARKAIRAFAADDPAKRTGHP
jgi:hypothetical protein